MPYIVEVSYPEYSVDKMDRHDAEIELIAMQYEATPESSGFGFGYRDHGFVVADAHTAKQLVEAIEASGIPDIEAGYDGAPSDD